MKRAASAFVCLSAVLAMVFSARAGATLTGKAVYDVIARRNVFSVHPEQQEIQHDRPPPPPSAKVKLSGITTIFGDKCVLFVVQDPAVPGQRAPAEKYYMLTVGQRDGEFEVLDADEKAGTVRLRKGDEILSLTLPTTKLPDAPPPAPVPPGIAAN